MREPLYLSPERAAALIAAALALTAALLLTFGCATQPARGHQSPAWTNAAPWRGAEGPAW
jgi:hypothetical protein